MVSQETVKVEQKCTNETLMFRSATGRHTNVARFNRGFCFNEANPLTRKLDLEREPLR